MLPASSKGGGVCMGFPDVCKVPAPPAPFVPTPFPNIGTVSDCSSTIAKVKIQNKEAVVLSSKMSSSKGDEAGTLGGMISAVNRNQVAFRKASSKVYFGGKQAVHVTSMTAHNGANANLPAGAQVAPSQVKVLVAL